MKTILYFDNFTAIITKKGILKKIISFKLKVIVLLSKVLSSKCMTAFLGRLGIWKINVGRSRIPGELSTVVHV